MQWWFYLCCRWSYSSPLTLYNPCLFPSRFLKQLQNIPFFKETNQQPLLDKCQPCLKACLAAWSRLKCWSRVTSTVIFYSTHVWFEEVWSRAKFQTLLRTLLFMLLALKWSKVGVKWVQREIGEKMLGKCKLAGSLLLLYVFQIQMR